MLTDQQSTQWPTLLTHTLVDMSASSSCRPTPDRLMSTDISTESAIMSTESWLTGQLSIGQYWWLILSRGGTQISQDFGSVGVHTMNIIFFSTITLNHVEVFKIQAIATLRRFLNVHSIVCDEATNQWKLYKGQIAPTCSKMPKADKRKLRKEEWPSPPYSGTEYLPFRAPLCQKVLRHPWLVSEFLPLIALLQHRQTSERP